MSLSRNTLTPGALVLGAGGNVGFGVVGALLEAGSPVLAVGREGPRMSALAEHFDDAQLIELVMVIGHYHLVSFALNSLGVQLEPGVEGFTEGGGA